MIDFSIVWSVILALMLIRIVDMVVDYAHYQLTKKKREKALAEWLEELKATEPSKKPVRRATVKKTVKKKVR